MTGVRPRGLPFRARSSALGEFPRDQCANLCAPSRPRPRRLVFQPRRRQPAGSGRRAGVVQTALLSRCDAAAPPPRQHSEYASQHRWPKPTPAECRISCRPLGNPTPAAPGSLEYFLVERSRSIRSPKASFSSAACAIGPINCEALKLSNCTKPSSPPQELPGLTCRHWRTFRQRSGRKFPVTIGRLGVAIRNVLPTAWFR